MLVLNFSVVNGMPISDTIHNQITWNRVQHLAIIKDMWGLTSSRAWGYNNFASVSQLIANYRFATQDESSCPKLSNAVTNAVTASPKAQFSQCKQLALTIHYGKDCYLLSTSLSIFLHSESSALDLQYTQSILLLPWPNIWAKQNLLKIKTWGTSVMIELSSDSQCRLMPSKQGSAVEGNQTQKWLLDGTSTNKHKAWVAHKHIILLLGPGLALGATIVTHELCLIQTPRGLHLLVSGSCYLGPLPGGTNGIQKFSTSEWKQRTCSCCHCWSIQAHQNHYIWPLPQNGHVQIQRR